MIIHHIAQVELIHYINTICMFFTSIICDDQSLIIRIYIIGLRYTIGLLLQWDMVCNTVVLVSIISTWIQGSQQLLLGCCPIFLS